MPQSCSSVTTRNTWPISARIQIGRLTPRIVLCDRCVAGTPWNQFDTAREVIRGCLQVRRGFPERRSKPDQPRRRKARDHPLAALEDTFLNALMHRDHTRVGHIQIRVEDGQIESPNPGGLPAGTTLPELLQGRRLSRPRNPPVATTFHATNLVETWRTGTTRMRRLTPHA